MGNDKNSILKGYNLLLYFAGSMIMYEPDEECVTDFWTDGLLKTLPVNSRNSRFVEAVSLIRNGCKDKSSCISMLQNDHQRLLNDGGVPVAPAVKSAYCGAVSGNAAESVSEFYNSYGWKFRSRYNFPDDNLGIELLFLTLLIDKYMDFDDQACRIEMGKEIRRFTELHLLSWIPLWNERMQEHASTSSYKGIAVLIYACIEDIYSLMAIPESEKELFKIIRN